MLGDCFVAHDGGGVCVLLGCAADGLPTFESCCGVIG